MEIHNLQWQVQREYNIGYKHIANERTRKRTIMNKVLPQNLANWEVRVNLLWKNMQLENSLFLTDKLSTTFTNDEWVLGQEVMEAANKVVKFDDEDMDLYDMREDIVNHNALYWASITTVDWWDNDEFQPISWSIDPLSVIPDPKNWRGNKMRFIWFERRLRLEELKRDSSYSNIEKVESYISAELEKNQRRLDIANNVVPIQDNEWLIDIYDHFTTFEWKKYLTTWGADRTVLLRKIELEPLTEAERKKPSKIEYPVQIHRRKPKYWSFFWVSIADEILQYQDAISVLTNLQVIQARLTSLWPDKFVDSALWVNMAELWQRQPWWRIIPVDRQPWETIWASVYTDQHPNPSQYGQQIIQELTQNAESTTWAWALAFGQSPAWWQTKAEVQTLMQNTNQLLNFVASNYMRWQKSYWKAHYRSYVLNMPKKGKKMISLFENGKAFAKSVERKDFIAEGKFQVHIESKAQKAIKDEKNSAKLLWLANLYLGNMKPWYAMNKFLRKLWDTMWIAWFEWEDYIEKTVDEKIAEENLTLLNRNIDIADPEVWEDYETYIEIYEKALDTDAKHKILDKYRELATTKQPEPTEMQQWQWDAQTGAMAMNQLAWQQSANNQIASTADVTL